MIKKEKFNYYNKFIEMTEYILKSVNILKETVSDFNISSLDDNINEVHRQENKADNVVHAIRNNLIKDFLPPIDREDIAAISKRLDNIEDGIDGIMRNLRMLNITKIKDEVIELIDILIVCCEAVNDIFLNLNDFKDTELINKKISQVNTLEEKGDMVYGKLMTLLYREDKDPISIIKWTKIYTYLEEAIDVCEDVSDCIADIVMKNT